MSEAYGHHITPIHTSAKNPCDHCDKPARWETDYKIFGEHATQSSNPEQVCDTHAKAFAARWPTVEFPPKYSR
jgi:hypothetical protein